MRTTLIILVLLFSLNICKSQDLKLMAFSIDSTLTEDADAVLRYYTTHIRRTSLRKAVVEVKYAVTIMNKDGKKHARLVVPYDDHKQVQKIDGAIYNSLGMKKGELDKKEIQDYSVYPDFTFFADSRVKTIKAGFDDYPTTVEYEYTVKMDGLVGFDTWMPVRTPRTSLETATLTVETPDDLPIRYKTGNADFGFETSTEDGTIRYTWKLENQKAYTEEPYMPSRGAFLPWVMLAPNDFEYDHTTGNFENWENYGKWSLSLQQGHGKLSGDDNQVISELIKDDTSVRQSIETVYRFVQQNTRYVNISLGIGGFQPMSADEVFETGYGDCKALSNFTRTCLAAAGIKSFYAEIINDDAPHRIDPDFTSINQTNHVIVCVPQPEDTVWLECTSQYYPPGFIGSSNTNRNALLVTPEGGKLVNTPQLDYRDNTVNSTFEIHLTDGEQANGNIQLNFRGNSCQRISWLLHQSKKEQKEWLLRHFIPDDLSLESYMLDDVTDPEYMIRAKLDLFKENFARQAGSRLIFQPVVFHRQNISSFDDTLRQHDFYVKMGQTVTDTIVYSFPENYKIEFVPENAESSCEVGSFSFEVKITGNRIAVYRRLVLKQGLYPKSGYAEIYRFYKTVSDSDHSTMVLKKTD